MKPRKGQTEDWGDGHIGVWEGPYFDWPWHKRLGADIAYLPYCHYNGLRYWLWNRRRKRNPVEAQLNRDVGYYRLGYDRASERIRPKYLTFPMIRSKKHEP